MSSNLIAYLIGGIDREERLRLTSDESAAALSSRSNLTTASR
ncbi:MAG TPA: hypothetical protein VG496_04430 [Myxococcales bacterium]|nr:hypothetical protein [Myxococcales bacterium]